MTKTSKMDGYSRKLENESAGAPLENIKYVINRPGNSIEYSK